MIEKIKSLPKFFQVFILGMLAGAIGAGIMSLFGIELGTVLRNVYFIIMMGGSYLVIYKPFKK